MIESLISSPPFSMPQTEKERLLLPVLNELTNYHADKCHGYRQVLDALWNGARSCESLDRLPFLPVSIFKQLDLVSTSERTLLLQSSGTTGQAPSRIFVDTETSALLSRALIETLKPMIGEKRIPLLIIDTKKVISDPNMMTARSAGVLGLMKFGAKATFSLDDTLELDKAVVKSFLEANSKRTFLIFGFTFLVWSKLQEGFQTAEIDLSNGVLIHSGGWKKMEDQRVSNDVFKARLKEKFGLTRVCNYYGMVEQVGSLFLEGDDGLLYPPNFADVIIRDERTWEPLGTGKPGIVQVLSGLPRSYPGHSLLTEDRGEIVTVDAGVGGRLGKAIRIFGRLPKSELRGCSDVLAANSGSGLLQ
jgi:hypothetical protein